MKKIMTGLAGLVIVSFLTVGSVSASSDITPNSCGYYPGQPVEHCLQI